MTPLETLIESQHALASTCGWCPDVREKTAALKAQGYDVSHSICPTCRELWLSQIGESLLEADKAAQGQ